MRIWTNSQISCPSEQVSVLTNVVEQVQLQESNPEMKARDKVNPIGASLRRLGLTAGLATLWHRCRSWARRLVFIAGLAPLWYRSQSWARRQFGAAPAAATMQDETAQPLPPEHLINLVVGKTLPKSFLRDGARSMRLLAAASDDAGVAFTKAENVLDFLICHFL